MFFLVFALFFQNPTGLPFDIKGKNVAGLFTMTDEAGRLENIQMMEKVFKDGSLGFKSESHHNVTAKYIYERLTVLAKEVGETGTLLFYVNSHGGGSGRRFVMESASGDFRFSKALQSIAKANKVKRLIVLIDTCHAQGGIQEGWNENGDMLINIKTGLYELPEFYRVSEKNELFDSQVRVNYGVDSGAYEECLVLASTSVDTLSTRTIFPTKMKETLDRIKGDKFITVAGFLRKFGDSHRDVAQRPFFKALPNDNLLSEPLFSNLPVRDIPVIDKVGIQKSYKKTYVILPSDL